MLLSILPLLKLNPIILFIIISLIVVSVDIFTFIGLRLAFKNTSKFLKAFVFSCFWLLTACIITTLVWAFFFKSWIRNPSEFADIYQISNALFISINSKLIFCSFLLIHLLLSKIKILERTRIIIKMGLVVTLFILSALVYGTIYGRFNFKVHSINLTLKELPKAYDGVKIVQISDLHLGTLPGHEKEFKKAVDIVNTQKPDFLFLTGDIVNCFSEEIIPFKQSLAKLTAKFGKLAILGNHDYGDYYRWKNKKELAQDRKQLIEGLQQCGFEVLLNNHKSYNKGSDTIVIAGIENWGNPPFKQLGDVDEALTGVPQNRFVMLLSHDPIFWSEKIASKKDIPITFSGHTHGLQIGISGANFEWSPLWFMNKMPAGLYQNGEQYLYVNRGLGGALYPGRIGIWPEISVFYINKAK